MRLQDTVVGGVCWTFGAVLVFGVVLVPIFDSLAGLQSVAPFRVTDTAERAGLPNSPSGSVYGMLFAVEIATLLGGVVAGTARRALVVTFPILIVLTSLVYLLAGGQHIAAVLTAKGWPVVNFWGVTGFWMLFWGWAHGYLPDEALLHNRRRRY